MVTLQDVLHRFRVTVRSSDKIFLKYPHTNSSNSSPYISLKKQLRDFVKRSKYFSLVIILFSNSHNLLPSLCVEIVGRELSRRSTPQLASTGLLELSTLGRFFKRKPGQLPLPSYWAKKSERRFVVQVPFHQTKQEARRNCS